ncbi:MULTISPECIES: hypothetical protein [unclassified Bradyrhizobium]|uniref:hypothetical protein n=1 Tax=unclassified Bradyrhizobium TaxID=2631580 RepID=UPI0024784CF4|nr:MULTISPECIES: hypothetical protein [unclassified Bradyrhizobium]WGS22626.1 hypothetical protein MTX22_13745 [Bradyrhizobium sp. ISRA463]WGS29611.1 hypothetical protein MTX19_11515 [Bradyrhizobium sp. ISRA464]
MLIDLSWVAFAGMMSPPLPPARAGSKADSGRQTGFFAAEQACNADLSKVALRRAARFASLKAHAKEVPR